MKRIKAACITQTIHFSNVEGKGSEYGKRKYRKKLHDSRNVWIEKEHDIKSCLKKFRKTVL